MLAESSILETVNEENKTLNQALTRIKFADLQADMTKKKNQLFPLLIYTAGTL